MKTVGEILREKREQKDLSIKEISMATNISPNYLTAIENNDFTQIPGETYIIGFIRNYANYLGVNSDELVKLYKEYMRYEQEVPLEMLTPKEKNKVPGMIVKIVIILLLISGIVLLIVMDNPVKSWFLDITSSFNKDRNNVRELTSNTNDTEEEGEDFLDNLKDDNLSPIDDIEKIRKETLSDISKANIELELRLLRKHQNYVISYAKDGDKEITRKLAFNENLQLFANESIILKVTDAKAIELKIKNMENEKIINGEEYFSEQAGQLAYFEIKYEKNKADESLSNIIVDEKGMNIEQIIIPSVVIPNSEDETEQP